MALNLITLLLALVVAVEGHAQQRQLQEPPGGFIVLEELQARDGPQGGSVVRYRGLSAEQKARLTDGLKISADDEYFVHGPDDNQLSVVGQIKSHINTAKQLNMSGVPAFKFRNSLGLSYVGQARESDADTNLLFKDRHGADVMLQVVNLAAKKEQIHIADVMVNTTLGNGAKGTLVLIKGTPPSANAAWHLSWVLPGDKITASLWVMDRYNQNGALRYTAQQVKQIAMGLL